jgi:hypothetical protein
MSIPSNLDRAVWAAHAIDTFRGDTGNLCGEEAVHDLVFDLGHYCRLYELDFLSLVANGISTWCAEEADPDGMRLDPGPHVSILVPGRKRRVRPRRRRYSSRKQHSRKAGGP